MTRRRSREQTIFFPWERRGSLLYRADIARARPFAVTIVTILVLLLLGARERRRTGIRATRTKIGVVSAAVDAYRADHDHKCPTMVSELKTGGYMVGDPVDAWGHPLRLICPGRRDPQSYDLMSDGPDGVMGGLDRVE